MENNLLRGLSVRLQTMEIIRTADDDVAFLYRYMRRRPPILHTASTARSYTHRTRGARGRPVHT